MAIKYAEAHQSRSGPGDARPTAFQIVEDEGLVDKLSGSTILLTGCSSGIGVSTSRALFQTGANLYLTARDINKARSVLGEELIKSPNVHLLSLDLTSLASVRACAAAFLSHESKLDIFIANAGVMATPEGRTRDGFETQLQTNHLSHFLLFNLLKPALLSAPSSRAIFVASMSHRSAISPDFNNLNLDGCYDPWLAYSQSKLFEVWTANEIDRKYGARGLHAWSLNPGSIATTGLGLHLSDEVKGALMGDEALMKTVKTEEQGAATTVWAALASELDAKGIGGKFLEDCCIIGKWDGVTAWMSGYGELAYDEEGERKLWKASAKMVGLEDSV